MASPVPTEPARYIQIFDLDVQDLSTCFFPKKLFCLIFRIRSKIYFIEFGRRLGMNAHRMETVRGACIVFHARHRFQGQDVLDQLPPTSST